ncbi:MAG TPA: ABC transporter ATP-binding protein [Acidimicrobiales bacterium]|nr:ABC transporter ATP-binding protein [Acidimicrobiales bacterium]
MNAPNSIAVTGAVKRFGDTEVLRQVDLQVEPGAVVALLGPSGCGKTTLLRSIAGLERLDGGEVHIGGRLVSGDRTHVPPERRRVGMVFQDWALFPHLSVAQNVGYGLPRAERGGARVDAALAMVGLAGMGDRSPTTLSGGQQQRVALARALAPQPGVLLLDEPFSNLDSALRVQVRTEVHQLLADLEVTTVFVTHDQEEAFVLGDEVAVMHGGRIVQQATPAALYARPASPWVARFVGDANLVGGSARGTTAATPVGAVELDTRLEGPVQVLLRPEELHLVPAAGDDVPGADRGLAGTVELCEYYGHDTVYLVRPDDGPPLRARAGSVPQFGRGDRVAITYHGPPAVAYPGVVDDEEAADHRVGDGPTPGDGMARLRQPVPPIVV